MTERSSTATRTCLAEEIDGRVRDAMERFGVPGVALGIIDGDNELVSSFGVTSVEHPLPVDERTLFRVYSLTKTVVALAAARLSERGVLDLDAPLRRYLPDLKLSSAEVTNRVTMRHLLTHTAGWSDTPQGPEDAPLASITEILAGLPQAWPMGLWSYNNSGLMLAGRAIEVVHGRDFDAALHDLALDPLGMGGSFLRYGEMIGHRLAIGHVSPGMTAGGDGEVTTVAARVVRPWRESQWSQPAFGLASTLHDMLALARVHLNGGSDGAGRRLLAAETVSNMHRPLTDDGQLGLSWFRREIDGALMLNMGGSGLGYGAYVMLVPSLRFGAVILANAAGHRLDREISRWLLHSYLGLPDDGEPEDRAADQLAEYEGEYLGEHQRLTITAAPPGLRLAAQRLTGGVGGAAGRPPAADSVPLAFYGPDAVVVPEGSRKDRRGDFLRDSAGEVAMFRFPTVLYRRVPAGAGRAPRAGRSF